MERRERRKESAVSLRMLAATDGVSERDHTYAVTLPPPIIYLKSGYASEYKLPAKESEVPHVGPTMKPHEQI